MVLCVVGQGAAVMTLQELDRQAKILVGWPDCECDVNQNQSRSYEPGVTWVHFHWPMKTLPKRHIRRRMCKHRRVLRALIRAYRAGRSGRR